MGLVVSICHSEVRPRDYGSTSLGVRNLVDKVCTLLFFDMAGWIWEDAEIRYKINLSPTFSWLERVGPQFPCPPVYNELHSNPEELLQWCLSQTDCDRRSIYLIEALQKPYLP